MEGVVVKYRFNTSTPVIWGQFTPSAIWLGWLTPTQTPGNKGWDYVTRTGWCHHLLCSLKINIYHVPWWWGEGVWDINGGICFWHSLEQYLWYAVKPLQHNNKNSVKCDQLQLAVPWPGYMRTFRRFFFFPGYFCFFGLEASPIHKSLHCLEMPSMSGCPVNWSSCSWKEAGVFGDNEIQVWGL